MAPSPIPASPPPMPPMIAAEPKRPPGRPKVLERRRMRSIHLDATHDAFLTELVERSGLSRSAIVRTAIESLYARLAADTGRSESAA